MAGEFGLILRKARKDKGMTLEEIATKLNTNKVRVYHWEAGENFPKPGTVDRLAEIVGVNSEVFHTIIRWEQQKRKTGRCEEAEKFLVAYILQFNSK